MRTRGFVAQLTALVVIAFGVTACGVGEIDGGLLEGGNARDGVDDTADPATPTPTPTPAPAFQCPGASPDVAARSGWQGSDASEPADGALRFELKARPTAANLNGLVAVGAETIDDFDKAAVSVRFADNGLVDVRDGAFYASDLAYPYEPGVWYSIGIAADLDTQTYDVEIGPCGEDRELLIEDASFRNNTEELSSWAAWSSQTAALEMSTPAWMTSGRCVPATCASLGQECGQPGDGCGGTLDCGGCGNAELCDSGFCVEELVTTPPPPACVPDTCELLNLECGGVRSDGCGGYIACGDCESGSSCSSGVCVADPVSPPPPPACVPETCESLSRECGVASDGCGGALSCGSCQSGYACNSGVCEQDPVTPPPPACIPETCPSLGLECGMHSDGCGGTLNCGGCSAGACSSGMCVVPPEPPAGQPERPWSHNTGPTDPGALSPSGTVTVTTSGAVLEDLDVSGMIVIDADDVTIRNFRVAASTSYGIKIANGLSGIVLEDGEIYGMSSAAILGVGFTARRLHIHDSSGDGIKGQGSGGPTLVEYCFIEKLGKGDGAHADGNQTRGGSNITFRYNNIYMPNPGTPSYPGAPYKSNATFILQLSISNFVIENNWLTGGNYTIYCSSGASVRNNIFGRENAGWPDKEEMRVRSGTCGQWSGNVWEDTGQPL